MNGNWHETRRVHEALCCAVLCHSVMPDSLRPHGLYSLPGSTVLGNSPGKNTGGGCHALLWGNLPALQADSLLSEPVGPWKAEHRRIGGFKLCCWKRLLRVPWTARRSNQSILKEINPEYSLEGLMLKLKRQYFGHMMQRPDSLEKTLLLGKVEGRRRRG